MGAKWPPMERRGPQVAEAQIISFEARLGHSLPDDYRQFLLDINGGRPADSHCDFEHGVINSLFSLDDAESESRDLATRANRARPHLPGPDLLFVGHDDGGSRILLALAGRHRGEVWLMLHDERPHDANPRVAWSDRRDMRRLADSFKQFMDTLKPLKG